MKYDLHAHSLFSDGDLSPEELIESAVTVGITHLALTDHDSVSGLERAQVFAQQHPITLIQGIEFSCNWSGQLLHMLGLNVDPASDQLLEGAKHNQTLREKRAGAMHEDFLRNGIDLRERVHELVGEFAVPTRPHFAQALVDLEFVKNKNQAFKRYLTKGKVGFIPIEWPSVSEVAQWISASGGTPVLAHPARYRFTRTKLIRLIQEMKAEGVHAMEVSTPVTTAQQARMLADLCTSHDLYASMGSDFHSHSQPWAKLGSAEPLPSKLRPVWDAL